MPDRIKPILAVLAGFPAVWLFSLLLHAIDADANSAAEFWALATAPAVYGIACFLYLPCLLAIFGFWAQGSRTYITVLLGTIVSIGIWLTVGGSTASTLGGYLMSFSGVALFSSLFFLPGTLPAVLLIRAQRRQ